jgi:hypothetical protein
MVHWILAIKLMAHQNSRRSESVISNNLYIFAGYLIIFHRAV